MRRPDSRPSPASIFLFPSVRGCLLLREREVITERIFSMVAAIAQATPRIPGMTLGAEQDVRRPKTNQGGTNA